MMMKKFTTKNQVRLLHCSPEFPKNLIETINKARFFILLHTYICDDDEEVLPIFQALYKKAQEGIRVYVLVDAFGSQALSDSFFEQFKHENFHYDFFERFLSFKFKHFGRRLHQKVLICDNTDAIIGGINLGKRFWNPDEGQAWIDYAIHIQGEEVSRIIRLSLILYLSYFPQIKQRIKNARPHIYQHPTGEVKLVTYDNDWMKFKNNITKAYIDSITRAKSEISLVASYFVPSTRLLKKLALKARQGVKVELILSGPTDVPLEKWSRRYLYHWMMKKGIIIYEWKASVVHAKIALIDDSWVTVGSYNHNFISKYDNLEMNTFVQDRDFAQIIKKEIAFLKDNSELYNLEEWDAKRNFLTRFLEFFSYFLATLISFISVTITIRTKEKPLSEYLE